MTLSMPNYIPSISVLRGVGRPHHLPSTLRLYHLLNLFYISHPHPSPPSLPSPFRREDLDPTSSWVFALLCENTGPFHPHCCLSTLLPPIEPNPASAHRLLNYVFSHRDPHKTIHPSSIALWACTDHSFLSRPKSGSVAGCSVGLGDPPPYLLNPPPESHRQSWKDKQSIIRASHLLQSRPSDVPPTPVIHNAPLHAFCQRIPVVIASVVSLSRER